MEVRISRDRFEVKKLMNSIEGIRKPSRVNRNPACIQGSLQ